MGGLGIEGRPSSFRPFLLRQCLRALSWKHCSWLPAPAPKPLCSLVALDTPHTTGPFPRTVLEGGSPPGYSTLCRLSGATFVHEFIFAASHLASDDDRMVGGQHLLISGWEQEVGCIFSGVSYPGLPPKCRLGRPDPGQSCAQHSVERQEGGGEVAAENPDLGPWPGGWLHPYSLLRPPSSSSPEGKHGRFSRLLVIFRFCNEPQTLVEHSLKRNGSLPYEIKQLHSYL